MKSDSEWSSSEYDQRQYRLILARLESYSRHEISLPKLIADLQSLVSTLESTSPEWKHAFLGEWWTLEQVFAAASDSVRVDQLLEEYEEIVKESVCSMTDMVRSALGTNSSK